MNERFSVLTQVVSGGFGGSEHFNVRTVTIVRIPRELCIGKILTLSCAMRSRDSRLRRASKLFENYLRNRRPITTGLTPSLTR